LAERKEELPKGLKTLIYLGVFGVAGFFAYKAFAGEAPERPPSEEPPSPPSTPPSPPSTPPRVSTPVVTGPDKAEVDVSWDPVPGATYYQVFVNGQYATQVRGTTVRLTTLKPGRTYQIAVAACN
jgi:hypothetical protein